MSYEEEISCGVQQMLDADLQFPQESAENAHSNSCKKCNSWIPVTERLPEEDVLVLCIGKKGGMFLGYPLSYHDDRSAYTHVPNSRHGRYTTHWMPLPEPPVEDT